MIAAAGAADADEGSGDLSRFSFLLFFSFLCFFSFLLFFSFLGFKPYFSWSCFIRTGLFMMAWDGFGITVSASPTAIRDW